MMQHIEQPLVSVVIPCYNHEQFIQGSIQSLVDQTYKNIELIIIDDGSQDSSALKIEEMVSLCEKRFTRFEFRVRDNKGLSETLNEMLDWCEGEYLTICSSDDFFHKDKVYCQINYLLENKSCKFCITESYVVNDLNENMSKATNLYNAGIKNGITFSDIFLFRVHLPVTGMYNTYFLKFVLGGFDKNLTAEDYDINLKIVKETEIGVIFKKLFYYRSSEALGSTRIRMTMRIDVSESHLKTIKKYKNHPEYKNALVEWNFRRSIYYSAYGQTKIYAFKGMVKSYRKVNNILYLKSLVRLFFWWK